MPYNRVLLDIMGVRLGLVPESFLEDHNSVVSRGTSCALKRAKDVRLVMAGNKNNILASIL